MVPVVAPTSPLLNELEDDEPAAAALHAGDLVFQGVDRGPLGWKATVEGQPAARDGMTFELRPTSGSAINFGFRSDFGPAIRVPTAAFICARGAPVEARASCATTLVRARAHDGSIVAWTTFAGAKSSIMSVRAGRVLSITTESISGGRVLNVGSKTLLLALVRSASPDGRTSGGSLLVVRVTGGPLAILRSIELDQVDATKKRRSPRGW
jgi:hypothetical protein